MKAAMILACVALLLFAWMFRYEVSGQVGPRPVMLDRWTGNTYPYSFSDGWKTEPIAKP
jgi:hypothetical protein